MAYTRRSHYKEILIDAVKDIAREDEKVVFLDADLSSCIGSTAFEKEFPDRFFNCGIAEANMVGVAAGLSSTGMVPFVHSFGCFASRRVYDQLFLSVGYAKQRVIVIGSDPGITAQYNGGTHMPFEDIALMRQIPDMAVVEPSDDYSLYMLTKAVYESGKAAYIRTPRKGIVYRYEEGTDIELGKAKVLRRGSDVAIIALGAHMVNESMKAAEILKEKGINAEVIDLLTVKPMDEKTVIEAAAKCGKVLVCENGRYAGGIGEAIAALLVRNCPVPMDFVSVGERYGEVGNLAYLANTFGLTAENIAAKEEVLSAK